MNVRGHQISYRLVDESVASHLGQTRKPVADQEHREMAASVGGPGVASMTIAVVEDLESPRLEQLQPPGEHLESRLAQGSTLTKGCTSNDSNTFSVT